MIFRMAGYHSMLMRKYGLPIEQFVLFMGKGKSNMITEIKEKRLCFNYHIIELSQVDYKVFLSSEKPEERILAILADFKGESDEVALKN